MGQVKITCIDIVVLAAIAYGITDLISHWFVYNACQSPIHIWLLVSYSVAVNFRLVQYLNQLVSFRDLEERVARSKHCLGAKVRYGFVCFFNALFGALFLFYLAWTILGSFWYRDATFANPCLTKFQNSWFMMVWLIVCFIWLLCYLILLVLLLNLKRTATHFKFKVMAELRHRPQQLEMLQTLISEELTKRQELVETLQEYGFVILEQGLPSAIISRILTESYTLLLHDHGFWFCPLCLLKFGPSDLVKRFPGCGHVFHDRCIDYFLQLDCRCPSCLLNVRTTSLFSQIVKNPGPLALADGL